MEVDSVGRFGFGTWKSDFHWSIPVDSQIRVGVRWSCRLLTFASQSKAATLIFFLFVWPEGALTVGAPRFSSMLEESPSSPKLSSRSVRSTNVWTGREPNLQPPMSSCRVSQQFHEACGWNLTERSELAPEKLVSLWASLHQRHLVWSGRTAAFDTLWKRKRSFFFPSYRTKNTTCVYRSFVYLCGSSLHPSIVSWGVKAGRYVWRADPKADAGERKQSITKSKTFIRLNAWTQNKARWTGAELK